MNSNTSENMDFRSKEVLSGKSTFEGIVKKSDFVELKNDGTTPLTLTSPELTKAIMAKATDKLTLIKEIEKYSDDNKLPLGKRVPYSIILNGGVYINVAQAYPVGTDFAVVGWNGNGGVMRTFDNGKPTGVLNDVSTYFVDTDSISAVVFGSYDPSKVTVFDEKAMKDKEKELVELFTTLNNEINALSSAGAYRSMIIKINSVFLKNKLNDIDLYKYNPVAYKAYVQACANYIMKISDIINFYNDFTRNNKGKEYHKFGFFTSDKNRDLIVKMCESHTNVEKFRERFSDENTFTLAEVSELCKAVGTTYSAKNTMDYLLTYVEKLPTKEYDRIDQTIDAGK